MNIVVLQENITQALSKASKFLPSKTSTVSSVNNFYLKAEKGEIELKATDLETTIITSIAGKVQEEGEIILPSKPALSLFSLFSGEKITVKKEKKEIVVQGKKTQTKLKTEPAEAFPVEEKQEEGKEIIITREIIQKIVEKNSFSVSNDLTRAVLTGVLFSFEKNKIKTVSTDGFRLSLFSSKAQNAWEKDIIVPVKAIRALPLLFGEEKDIHMYYFNKTKKLSVSGKNDTIITRLIDGAFPDYKKIIPTGAQTEVAVDRQEFLQAVKLSSVFAREASNIVKVHVAGHTMTVSANAAQTGENSSEIEVAHKGEDIHTAFNYRFLIDILSALKKDQVVLESNGPLQPGVFHEGDKQSFFHIIMPVRLQEPN